MLCESVVIKTCAIYQLLTDLIKVYYYFESTNHAKSRLLNAVKRRGLEIHGQL